MAATSSAIVFKMDFLQAVILGIMEGISEFLPISSTGHLILTSKLLNIPQSEFTKTFEISIQLGAILSVVVLYGKRLATDLETVKKIIVAFIPTGILGLIFYKIIKDLLLESLLVTVGALLVGGIAIIFIERSFKHKKFQLELDNLSFKRAFGVGVIQSISMIPGVSRSAATIIGGMFLGLKREAAVELSFLLAIPTMFAATGYDLYKNRELFAASQINLLLVGFVVSFIVALIVVKWFLNFVKTSTLFPFGIYRIVLAVIFFLFLL